MRSARQRPFGIRHTNRKLGAMTGKNQFNSVFPVAQMMKMQELGIEPMVITAEHVGETGVLTLIDCTCPVENLIRSRGSEEVFHSFESSYCPFAQYQSDRERLVKTDIVFSEAERRRGHINHQRGRDQIASEIKLTVMPDQTTRDKPPEEWGPELVIRPSTTAYVAMSLFHGFDDNARARLKQEVSRLQSIKDWRSEAEVSRFNQVFLDIADLSVKLARESQVPALIQSLWTSEIYTPHGCEHSFDTIVWTDAAVLSLYLLEATKSRDEDSGRALRALTRFSRVMMELATFGRFSYDNAFVDIVFRAQNDKELSISGQKMRRYVKSPFMHRRRLPWQVLHDIIPEWMVEKLAPERRLDQLLYYFHREIRQRRLALEAAREMVEELGMAFDEIRYAEILASRESALSP